MYADRIIDDAIISEKSRSKALAEVYYGRTISLLTPGSMQLPTVQSTHLTPLAWQSLVHKKHAIF